jgi:hypothetical protein
MNRIFRMFEEYGETQLTQVDADGIAHIVHEFGDLVSITVTVKRGNWEFEAELPMCANGSCSLCHPTHDISGRPAWGDVRTPAAQPAELPSAFAYLLGEPHA